MKFKLIIFSVLCICILGASANAENDLPQKYDSRDYGIVTPVKDQGYTSLCWAYAAAGASEISVLKSGIDESVNANNLSFSPHQIGYSRHNRGADPLGNTTGEISGVSNWQNEGGGIKYAAAMLSQWCGPVSAKLLYNANGWENALYKAEEAVTVSGSNLAVSEEARAKMKKAIMEYGAVTFYYNNAREVQYYNPNGESKSSPHACIIIGWDDTISADKFKPGATTQDGGWLVKNSYDSNPYFYLSYDVTCDQMYAFRYAPNDKYDYNYFYDSFVEESGIGILYKVKRAANVYETKSDGECLKAVNVGLLGENAECTVNIYDADTKELLHSEDALFEYGGYNCVELKKCVRLKKGQRFAVEVVIKNKDDTTGIMLSYNESKSYIYRLGWNSGATARIKAFTKKEAYVEFADETNVKVYAPNGEKQLVTAVYENGCIKDVHIETADFGTEKTVNLPSGWQGDKYRVFLWDELMPVCVGDVWEE